jgi:hypothetical protein
MKTCKAAGAPELPQRGRYISLSLRGDGSQEYPGDFSSKPTSGGPASTLQRAHT